MDVREFLITVLLIAIFPDFGKGQGNFLFYYPPTLQCNEEFKPAYCGFPNVNLSRMENVEDFDNCGPGTLPLSSRNYYIGTSGRGITYSRNLEAYKKVPIIPWMLRDVSNSDISITILGQQVSSPIGVAPTAIQNLAHPDGELATARASSKTGSLMILSSLASSRIEDVAAAANEFRGPANQTPILWMQLYIFRNRQESLNIIRRAEASGFKAIVVTCDTPVFATRNCGSQITLTSERFPNLNDDRLTMDKIDSSLTFKDISWVKQNTKLPIIAKGITTGEDAVKAVRAGASAILVSNHGGRQLDSSLATFDALPDVVEGLKKNYPNVEVYLDGGIRNGFDVYKALARGARAVFIGRPTLWGLAVGGQAGVEKVLSILKAEFNETMILAGRKNPGEINSETPQPTPRPTIFPPLPGK